VGSLEYSRQGYRVQLPEMELKLPFGGREQLAPGATYRFFYLPGSGLVLSAEPQGTISPDAEEAGLTRVLAETNGFKLSALPANRRGELAVEQISGLLSTLVAPLALLLIPGGILYYQLRQGGYLAGSSLPDLLSNLGQRLTTGMMVGGGIALLAALAGLVLAAMTLLDLLGGSVRSVEGAGYRKITTSTDDDGSKTRRYYYVIEGTRFRVQRKGFDAFEDGLKYRAYFTPLRKSLVNIEMVG
jgi:hypothetical protein